MGVRECACTRVCVCESVGGVRVWVIGECG